MVADQRWSLLDGQGPVKGALEAEHLAPGVFMLRHPGHPYVAPITLGDADQEQHDALQIANAYLAAVASKLLEGAGWKDSKSILEAACAQLAAPQEVDGALSWLDIAWGKVQPTQTDPRGSFWVARSDAADVSRTIDRTLVLCAGFCLGGRSLGGEKGLRVVMHGVERPGPGGPVHEARITGMSMSLPGGRAVLQLRGSGRVARGGLDPHKTFSNEIAAGLMPRSAWTGHDLEPNPDGTWLERFFVNHKVGGDEALADRTHAVVVEIDRDAHLKETGRRWITLRERASYASADSVFLRDPASAGPSATVRQRGPAVPFMREADVDSLRRHDGHLARLGPGMPLEHTDPRTNLKLFEVSESRLQGGDPTRVQTKSARAGASPLRSDDLAAEHAYARGHDFFDRLVAYGFNPALYFRLVKLPLVLRHRAGIEPGSRDGEAVNSQVRPRGNGLAWHQAFDPSHDQRSQIEVRFGAANLSHRRVLPDARGRQRAQYLGLAADTRWAWHEFSHVLNFASTGELELRFAHSVGDALAAVIADPESDLVGSRADGAADRWRGVTFPWVALNRRHDREPALGWGFDSLRFRDALGSPLAPGERYRAYYGEQLLSSAMFRLYASLGGNSSRVATRCSAADYVVYLLMRAIALLGSASQTPARTPDQFVSALIDADVGTGVWQVATPWNSDPSARAALRCGHCVHKVIRWAFERQGLYGGLPPAVDVYIPDRRGVGGTPGDGGYTAVPLEWSDTDPQPWHAHGSAIRLDARRGQLTVLVRNRGSLPAHGVTVVAWVREQGTTPRSGSAWTMNPAEPVTVQPGGQVEVVLQADASLRLRPRRKYQIVAAISCPADRINHDPAQWLDGATDTLRLDVLAHDNNVALQILNT